ncbi:mannan endo-1,6-alpha-mannosidase [Sporothrix schenckii 1099-18]|uniref:Mannan endo-1,6-alpha-mannosidase n=2 Tax=Sporothrix schenckii TaxID=29908 RepID=U7PK34_SPOS1|nr:mannan endo-1,6-alpha-mannosidase [Sporothrix schenckii 1099-18]ERS94875.1 hypothetical protein HMPREF1624_08773 [Sporothrix schenckii ATCC 58251]KJR88978.1 mannan endo-1,6-alpha-mannosidase [Sporothrix schenckii 1099-18]
MRFSTSAAASLATALLAPTVTALDVDLNSPASIKAACKVLAKQLLTYYHGDQPGWVPGILPGPPPNGDYYWWEGGAMWGTLIDYWRYTQDTQYNNMTETALLFQTGPPQNCYMPPNWTASLGNDDQGFWGLSAMLAAESNFQNPPDDQPQWLALAQAVWNTQAAPDRHDQTCGGGMRWQIPLTNNGYDYKNSIANGIFFNMGARLARYTKNDTYAQEAIKTWDWVAGVGLMSSNYDIYDGAHVEKNCTDIAKAQFTYNAAVYLQGAAFMYNYTNGSTLWKNRVLGLTNRAVKLFFDQGGAVEISCELPDRIQCTTDMLTFKGFLHRWMAATTQIAPFVHDIIMPALKKSTAAAMKSCDSAGVCGFRWTTGAYDGMTGAGQQMNALAALSSLLVDQAYVHPPFANGTGATSKGNPAAGLDTTGVRDGLLGPVTTADRAGAGILTLLMLSSLLLACGWLSTNMSENGKWNSLS